MTDIKLAKLPDRTPVKAQITLSADLHQALQDYADHYERAYGTREPLTELIPFMLETFLASDRSFVRRPR